MNCRGTRKDPILEGTNLGITPGFTVSWSLISPFWLSVSHQLHLLPKEIPTSPGECGNSIRSLEEESLCKVQEEREMPFIECLLCARHTEATYYFLSVKFKANMKQRCIQRPIQPLEQVTQDFEYQTKECVFHDASNWKPLTGFE